MRLFGTLALTAALLGGCGSGEDSATVPEPTAAESTSTDPAPLPPPPTAADEGDRAQAGGAKEAPVGDGRGGVELVEVGGFDQPVYVTSPPDFGADIYVVTQPGKVTRVSPDGTQSDFLDVSTEITAGGEQGLLSLAFAPDFKRSGRFYVDYTDQDGNTRVVEYTSPDGRRVEGSSRRELLRIDQPFANHNGGLVVFGPDDLLYIGTGDGGSGGDPERNAQDTDSLLGKILRIDPRGDGGKPYGIPKGNPFSSGGGRGEIYAYGLRNPWRFSFDRKGGGLAIGDVGQDSFEEVTLVSRKRSEGANFGWSAFEGDDRFNEDQSAPDQISPSLVYPTADGNCSVTGGYVVRDQRLRSLYGRYLYGDFCKGKLRSFIGKPGKAGDDKALGLESIENLSSFGTDRRGRIYVTSLGGTVSRLEPKG